MDLSPLPVANRCPSIGTTKNQIKSNQHCMSNGIKQRELTKESSSDTRSSNNSSFLPNPLCLACAMGDAIHGSDVAVSVPGWMAIVVTIWS
jgi:hypothetical protein